MPNYDINDQNVQIQFLKQLGIYGEKENLFFLKQVPLETNPLLDIYNSPVVLHNNFTADTLLINKTEKGIGVIPFYRNRIKAQSAIFISDESVKGVYLIKNKEINLFKKKEFTQNLVIQEEEGHIIQVVYDENDANQRNFYEKYHTDNSQSSEA